MSFNEYWQAEQRRHAVAVAIAGMKPGDHEAEKQLFQSLEKATLLLAVEELPEGMELGDLLAGKRTQVKIRMLRGKEGELFVPAFTGEEAFRRSHGADGYYLLVPFPIIAQMASNAGAAGVMINRAGPTSALVPAASLRRFLPPQSTQPTPAPEQASTGGQPPQMQVGPPPRPINQREVAALDRWLRGQPGLAVAYLFGLLRADGQTFLTLGLGFLQPPPGKRVQALAEKASEILGPSGILLLDDRLARRLARQQGAVRFDIKESGSAGTQHTWQPSDPPPGPESPDNQKDR